nr:MAG: capsid protein [ssDNA virus sp.]
MARRYGRYRRRRFRSTRRYRRRPMRRFKRFRRSRRRRTISSVVKLTQDASWQLNVTGSSTGVLWNPFSFSPVSMPGFSDYQTTYSHFRILKAKLFVSRTINDNDGALYNYLVVGSRPFAATQGPFPSVGNTPASFVPAQREDALRQTKWQRIHYPSTTTQRVTAGFYPYTMVGTFGPAQIGNASVYQRIWEAKRWMPFNWAWQNPSGTDRGTSFFGPYMVVDTATGELPADASAVVQCTLQVHFQFKGQR